MLKRKLICGECHRHMAGNPYSKVEFKGLCYYCKQRSVLERGLTAKLSHPMTAVGPGMQSSSPLTFLNGVVL